MVSPARRSWHRKSPGTTVEVNVKETEPPAGLLGEPAFTAPSGPDRIEVNVARGAAKFHDEA